MVETGSIFAGVTPIGDDTSVDFHFNDVSPNEIATVAHGLLSEVVKLAEEAGLSHAPLAVACQLARETLDALITNKSREDLHRC